MLDKTTMTFSHVRPGDTDFKGEGLRDFFFYRDLGIAEATAGKMLAQLVRSNNAPEKGTGWHYHGADFHVVMTATTERGPAQNSMSSSSISSGSSLAAAVHSIISRMARICEPYAAHFLSIFTS